MAEWATMWLVPMGPCFHPWPGAVGYGSGIAAARVQWWHRLHPRPRNFHRPQGQPTEREREKDCLAQELNKESKNTSYTMETRSRIQTPSLKKPNKGVTSANM